MSPFLMSFLVSSKVIRFEPEALLATDLIVGHISRPTVSWRKIPITTH
jgi:hypothetical protein